MNTGRTRFKKGHLGYWTGKKQSLESVAKRRKAILGRTSTTEEQRNAIRKARSGDKCNFWKGGITSENKILRTKPKYKIWRKSVLERDDYSCRFCGVRNVFLHAHHIESFSKRVDLRYEVDNGLTLCVPCHQNQHPNIRLDIK